MIDYSPVNMVNLVFLFWTGQISGTAWFALAVATAATGFYINCRVVPPRRNSMFLLGIVLGYSEIGVLYALYMSGRISLGAFGYWNILYYFLTLPSLFLYDFFNLDT